VSLFGRQVIIQIGPPGGTGKEFRGLRTTFQVEANRSGKPAKAVIEVRNLNPDSISLLQAPGSVVRLIAGYDAPMQIFAGKPTKNGVNVRREGPDRVVHIEAQDGALDRAARVNVSFATDTDTDQVFAVVAAALGLPTGVLRTGSAIRLSQGVALVGPASEVLDRLCLSLGLRWYIRDGALVVEDGNTGEAAVCFSSATGNLVGSPQRTDQGVEVVGLMSPTLRPGKPFRVVSEEVNGDFVTDSLVFQGDSWQGDFYVIARGVPL
jgi:hypothetical protein